MADIHCHGSAQNCHLKSAESEPVTTIHIANCSQQKKNIMLKSCQKLHNYSEVAAVIITIIITSNTAQLLLKLTHNLQVGVVTASDRTHSTCTTAPHAKTTFSCRKPLPIRTFNNGHNAIETSPICHRDAP